MVGAAGTPTRSRAVARAGMPPWLWLWAVFFVVGVPNLMRQWQFRLSASEGLWAGQPGLQAAGADLGPAEMLLYPASLLDLAPALVLLVGLVFALLPRARATYVERRFRLKPPPQLPTIAEIESFVARHAPTLEIRANVLRSNPPVFVYPSGYGRGRVALLGGFLRLWRADRPVAEAILLHEIVHYRRGDAQVVGVGSLFEAAVRYAPLAYVALLLVPFTLVAARQLVLSVTSFLALGGAWSDLWRHHLSQMLSLYLPGLILSAGTVLFQMAAALTLPLAGIWALELNADYEAAAILGSSEALQRGLAPGSARAGLLRKLLFRLSHPPDSLRRRLLARNTQRLGVTWLLILPLASLLRLAWLHGAAVCAYLNAGYGLADLPPRALANTLYWLSVQPPFWFAMVALLLVWPLGVPYWERLFASTDATGRLGSYGPYAAAALVCATVAVAGLLVG